MKDELSGLDELTIGKGKADLIVLRQKQTLDEEGFYENTIEV